MIHNMTSSGFNDPRTARTCGMLILAVMLAASSSAMAQGGSKQDYERAMSLAKRTADTVFRDRVNVHWMPDNQRFWYHVQTGPKTQEFVLVEAETGKKTVAKDKESLGLPTDPPVLSSSLTIEIHPSSRSGEPTHVRFVNKLRDEVECFWISPDGVRKSYGRVRPGAVFVQNTFAGHMWLFNDHAGVPLFTFESRIEDTEILIDGKGKSLPKPHDENTSPNGKWTAFIKDANVQLKDAVTSKTSALTTDGNVCDAYHGIHWSPDSTAFVSVRVRKGQEHNVTIVESSPGDQLQPKLRVLDYLKAGDELPVPRPVIFDAATGQATVIDNSLFPTFFTEHGNLDVRWSPRSDEFFFDYNQRGHQLYRIIAVNAKTGAARLVVEEASKTFIDYTQKTWRHWLDKTGELLWMSERDGWCHLWLYDVKSGKATKQITQGCWVVRSVEQVDEDKRRVWFTASGLRAGEDPYNEHLCSVNLDGTGFAQLTDGDGNHKISFSPDHRCFVDAWSRADKPPVTELRRSDDGKLVTVLESADATALIASGWTLPERFVAKGRDGKTDIYGILIKPSTFDPAKKYPVVEKVYAGPHSAFAPKDFGLLIKEHEIADLGFIVVQSDGMGTNHRGKAFHDVCWKNLKDAGFPDRIAWIKEAAGKRPWMDLTYVGIFGGSAGGQSAMRALLDHHDFYSVAVADCGCHDNRMDKIWWNEQWLGWPVDDSYAANSNVVDAHKLKGHLMLAVGELDSNVDPATTMQVVNALEKADKDVDLVVMTGTGHGSLETPYGSRRRMDFLVRHLLKVEPRWQP